MLLFLLILNSVLICGALFLLFRQRRENQSYEFQNLQTQFSRLEQNCREDFKSNRQELSQHFQSARQEQQTNMAHFKNEMAQLFDSFQKAFDRHVYSINELQREKFAQLDARQAQLIQSTEKQLSDMRQTVDEKLQKTLNERLSQSFRQVSEHLATVQQGLGEMKNLAQDVGGLKRVLSHVKMRGGLGEAQLAALLENVLAPDQYAANVKTKKSSNDLVEFAIRMPNRDVPDGFVWLPVDAKFPRDVYEHLQQAYDTGEPAAVEAAQKTLENTIRKMAKDICSKYIDPPHTTDFAILFLPFEGIYAEVVRRAALLEEIQRDCKVCIAGPTNLAAFLNALQMGFRSLAIQQRSSEVWKVLGEVKKEFDNFGGMLEKAQKQLHTATATLDDVMGVRTRAIQRKLKSVTTSEELAAHTDLAEIPAFEDSPSSMEAS